MVFVLTISKFLFTVSPLIKSRARNLYVKCSEVVITHSFQSFKLGLHFNKHIKQLVANNYFMILYFRQFSNMRDV